jgi:peptidyl-prolyl cis-trans isomerase B (cyclophilin B)
MPHRRTLAVTAAISALTVVLTAPAMAQDELAPPEATPMPVPAEAPAGDGTAVRLETELGDVVIGLYNESAPVATENFVNLVEAGFYDGTGFHRVVEDFVVQGGDPDGTGAGGPPYRIRDELVVGTYDRGTVAMARSQQPDSQGSQFFFILDDSAAAALDSANTYAIFGRVLEGMDVVDAIVTANPPSDQVEDPVEIISATVEQVELPEQPASPPQRAAVNALAGLLPTRMGDLDTSRRAIFTSDQIQAQVPPQALADALAVAEEAGTDLSELSIAATGGQEGDLFLNVLAVRIPGVDAASVADQLAGILVGDPATLEATEETIAEREVTRLAPAGQDDPSLVTYRLLSDDIAFYIGGDADSVEAAVAALP